MKRYLVNGPSVTVRGVPSLAEQHRMTAEEKERIEQQRKQLDTDGLSKCEKMLSDAMEQNEVFCCFINLYFSIITKSKQIIIIYKVI